MSLSSVISAASGTNREKKKKKKKLHLLQLLSMRLTSQNVHQREDGTLSLECIQSPHFFPLTEPRRRCGLHQQIHLCYSVTHGLCSDLNISLCPSDIRVNTWDSHHEQNLTWIFQNELQKNKNQSVNNLVLAGGENQIRSNFPDGPYCLGSLYHVDLLLYLHV